MVVQSVASDETLVAQALAGEPQAFGSLVTRYSDECWRFAMRMLRNRDDAEDVVQETFLRAYLALPRYVARDLFRGWLFRILVNQCRTAMVARHRRERRFINGLDDEVQERGRLDPEPMDPQLERALGELDPLVREAILLKHGAGFEYGEMAALLGVGESALKMRVSRGCAQLRERLGGGHNA
ncbi:MAG TPA: RNA polymerase sigma factor [Gemmatimonadaceae bacterium]|nr:RNA polymerase sigma factor [Gemmatimonadaceae bacterium]